jgi:CubicO group peptidase (beta-lactamase class C family)
MHILAARGQFNGSVLVAGHGQMIYENAFGKADVRENISFAASTPCYLASLTKQFTAMAVMILNEEHKLAYADPLSKYFPEFPPYARKVTIRHLLNHTSGIPDYARLGLEHPGLTDGEVLNALLKQDSLDFPPGAKFRYSNSGYVLLALIIEKASGRPYRAFLTDRIFDPLGMKNSFVDDASRPHIPGRARGYNRFGDDEDYDLLTYGEGGMYSTVEDLFKWDLALDNEKLVNDSSLAMAFKGPILNDGTTSNYGFGWGLGDYVGQVTTSHAGRYGGFNTYIKRFVDERNCVIFLTNNDFKNLGAIGNALIDVLYGKPYALPKLSVADAMYKTYLTGGIAQAVAQYRSAKKNNDTTYDFGEAELNELGYELLGKKQFPDAIEILKLNVEAYPASGNVYDGLGEAYMDNGDKDPAIVCYKKELELDPGNTNAVVMLKKLESREK